MDPRPLTLHVSGCGAVSCFGAGHRTLIDAIFAGHSGVRPLERLAGTDCLTEVAAEVPVDLTAGDPDQPLALRFATLAAGEALREWGGRPDAGLLLVLASTKADLSGLLGEDPGNRGTGPGLGSPRQLAGRLAESLGLRGPIAAVSSACASGLSALAFAGRELRAGAATRALVVGTDCITPFILRGFSSLLALDPHRCRPFDRDRRGLNLGEGAGAMLLSTDPEDGRGLELLGWGESNDANHITGPSRDGSGLALAMERALHHVQVPATGVDLVHLHGTGTRYNDGMESRAVARVFAPPPPAAGSKAQIGHTLGAAGILESLITLAALHRSSVPGSLGFCHPDDEGGLELSPEARPLPGAQRALKIAAGFGGINAALVFGREK